MATPDTKSRIFHTAVGLIGNICAASFSLAAINDLFTRNGANPEWKTKAPYPYPSEKVRQVYYWLLGVETYAPDQTLSIAYQVLYELAATASIVRHEHKVAARNLLARIDAFTGARPGYQWHPRVRGASSKLYSDGHYKEAVREAFVALIDAVRQKSGYAGGQDKDAMVQAFKENNGLLRISNDLNEQQGYQFLFTGAVSVIRNPLSHAPGDAIEEHEAVECLALASLLFRYLDRAEKVITAPENDG